MKLFVKSSCSNSASPSLLHAFGVLVKSIQFDAVVIPGYVVEKLSKSLYACMLAFWLLQKRVCSSFSLKITFDLATKMGALEGLGEVEWSHA